MQTVFRGHHYPPSAPVSNPAFWLGLLTIGLLAADRARDGRGRPAAAVAGLMHGRRAQDVGSGVPFYDADRLDHRARALSSRRRAIEHPLGTTSAKSERTSRIKCFIVPATPG